VFTRHREIAYLHQSQTCSVGHHKGVCMPLFYCNHSGSCRLIVQPLSLSSFIRKVALPSLAYTFLVGVTLLHARYLSLRGRTFSHCKHHRLLLLVSPFHGTKPRRQISLLSTSNYKHQVREADAYKAALRLRHLPHRLLFLRRLGRVHGPIQNMPARCTTSIRGAEGSTHQLSRKVVVDGGPSQV
jgi:hypothetical protein